MKSQSKVQPEKTWIRYIDKFNNAVVRLRDNIITTTQEDNSVLYEYDEIEIEIPNRYNLLDYINNNFRLFFDNYLIQYKQEKINKLNEQCEQTICAGFYSTALGIQHFYRFNKEEDQINFNQQATLLLLDPIINEIYWKTEDAGVLLHTREQFMQVLNDTTIHKQNNINKYWNLKSQVLNCSNESELNAVSW